MRIKEKTPRHADRLHSNLIKITFTLTLRRRTSIFIGYSNLLFHREGVDILPRPSTYCRGIFCSKSFDLDFILDDCLNPHLIYSKFDIL